jgi:WD40 repeat protein
MLLALEALPEPGFGEKRPVSSEAAAALHQAWLRNRETALAGHRGSVRSASFGPDGTHVVTASEDKTARVWNLQGTRPTFVALEGHQDAVNSASFSPDGAHVVTASEDKTARVWDRRGERPTFVTLEGHRAAVNSASFSPDGTHIVTASADGTVRVWPVFPDASELVRLVRAGLTRCLSQAQRDAYSLHTEHPAEDRSQRRSAPLSPTRSGCLRSSFSISAMRAASVVLSQMRQSVEIVVASSASDMTLKAG